MLKKFLEKEYLINYILIFYVFSLFLDLHIFYNSIATLIRVILITIPFLIIYFKYSNKNEKKLLLSYFIILIIYLIMHLYNNSLFNVSFIKDYSIFSEILYFIKMVMNVLVIYIVYKLDINKDKFKSVIYLCAIIISFQIIIPNIFKIGYTSYDFNKPLFNIFNWFTDGNIFFLTSSTKGYFHLTNQIAAILILYLPILLVYLKEKITPFRIITIISVIISLFMLGTRVSTYSVFIILIVLFICSLVIDLFNKKVNKLYLFILFFGLGLSYGIYVNSPLISRNLFYTELFREKEVSKEDSEFIKYDNMDIKLLSNEEFYKYLGYFNIDADFYYDYYPLELDREFYEDYLNLGTTKINDTRFLEGQIIKRVKMLNNNTFDNLFGIGYSRIMNIFNIERDYVMQYYALGIIGLIIILGVNIFLLLYIGFKMLFNLKRYFTYENVGLLFSLAYLLLTSYFTGNILNSISVIIPISFVLGYLLSKVNKLVKKGDNEYYLGFKTTTKSKEKIIKEIFKSKRQNIIYNINPIIVMNFLHNEKVKKEINKGEYNIPDGNGIVMASILTSNNIREVIPGINLMEDIVKNAEVNNYSIYLYGAKEASVVGTKEKLLEKYPKIKIVGYQNGYNKDKLKDIEKIKKTKPDILFVALGSPMQEEFIIDNKEILKDIKIIMPVGGSFDALSGNVKRAPKVIQKLKLEWLYRMIKEPKRFKQLFLLIKFGILSILFNFWYNEK